MDEKSKVVDITEMIDYVQEIEQPIVHNQKVTNPISRNFVKFVHDGEYSKFGLKDLLR